MESNDQAAETSLRICQSSRTERKWSVHYGGLIHGRSSYDVLSDAQRLSPDYPDADGEALVDTASGCSLPKLLPEMIRTDFSRITRLDRQLHPFVAPSA